MRNQLIGLLLEFKMKNNNKVCPKCGSIKITVQERGFKLGRAVFTSIILTPIVGGVVGLIGRKKLVNMCNDCGKRFKFKTTK